VPDSARPLLETRLGSITSKDAKLSATLRIWVDRTREALEGRRLAEERADRLEQRLSAALEVMTDDQLERLVERGFDPRRPSGEARELACLALNHSDSDEHACPASSEELIVELVREVQRLRVAAGEESESAGDHAEAEGALDDALTEVTDADAPDSCAVLARLLESGWQIVRSRSR
jgi:hypothetical protein